MKDGKIEDGMCLWEKLCVWAGGRLVHDGQNSPGELQQKLGITETNLYTKKYRLYMDGKPINTWVTFIYDERELWDVRASYKDPDGKGEITLSKEGTYDAIGQMAGLSSPSRQQAARREGGEVATREAS